MPTVEIPSAWLLVYPCGKHVDGWYAGVRPDGSIAAATADQAWDKLASSVSERRALTRDGWTIRPLNDGEKVKAQLCDCGGGGEHE